MTIPTPNPPQRVKKTPEGVSQIAVQTETCRITAPNGGAYWIQNGYLYDDSGVRIDELPDWFDGEFAKLTPAMQAKMNMQPKLNAPTMDTLGLPGLSANDGGGTERTTKSIDAPDMADGKPTNAIEDQSKLGKPVGPDLTAQPDPASDDGRPPRDANASIPSDPKQAAEDEEFLKQNPGQTPPRNPNQPHRTAAPVGEDLRSLNKADLVEVAKKEGVEVNPNDTKDMVANKILAHREGSV